MNLVSEITKKSEVALDVFRVCAENTLNISENPENDIEKVKDCLNMSVKEVDSLNILIDKACGYESKDILSSKILELATSLRDVFSTLVSIQETTIQYITAKCVTKDDSLATKLNNKLQECIKEKFLVQYNEFDKLSYEILELILLNEFL